MKNKVVKGSKIIGNIILTTNVNLGSFYKSIEDKDIHFVSKIEICKGFVTFTMCSLQTGRKSFLLWEHQLTEEFGCVKATEEEVKKEFIKLINSLNSDKDLNELKDLDILSLQKIYYKYKYPNYKKEGRY